MSQARRAVENAAGGRCSAEEPSIGAPPGPRWTARVDVQGFTAQRGPREGCGRGRSWRFAVKRSSTWLAHPVSGTAGPPRPRRRGSRPGWVGAQGRETPKGAARTRVQPGIERTAGCSWRESVAEVGRRIFPAANVVPEPATARRPGERGIARSDPPALDGADWARGERQGAGRVEEQQASGNVADREL